MDIGGKIKQARMNTGLTQEQAAEELGVSRQTISNWENEKTYPDIISVVKMSDLYHISLDHLLKEEKPMSEYLDYLEESTNTVKSKERLSKLILAAVYLAIWAFAIIAFWFFMTPGDAFAYGLIFLWVLLPVTTFVIALLIGARDHWGQKKWWGTLLFGLMYMLAEYATFSAANMSSFHKFNLPSLGMIPAGAVIAALGMGIGTWICRKGKKNK